MARTDHHAEQRAHKAERRHTRVYNARPRLSRVAVLREQLADIPAPTRMFPMDCEAA